jgi:hypothetical protein
MGPKRRQQRYERCKQKDEDRPKRLRLKPDESRNELQAGVMFGDQRVEGAEVEQKGNRCGDRDQDPAWYATWLQTADQRHRYDAAHDEVG